MKLSRGTKHPRGIIVWDFDRVLFDTERFYRGAEKILKKHGVPPAQFWKMVFQMRKEGGQFSIARVLRILREWKILVPEKKIRREIHDHLFITNYFTTDTDVLLHRLRKQGFIHMILSAGATSYLRKRVQVGCGKKFIRHFAKIIATRKPKHLVLLKIRKNYPQLPLFFIDDTAKNLRLAGKHVPGIITFYYSTTSGKPLRYLENKILNYAKKATG